MDTVSKCMAEVNKLWIWSCRSTLSLERVRESCFHWFEWVMDFLLDVDPPDR